MPAGRMTNQRVTYTQYKRHGRNKRCIPCHRCHCGCQLRANNFQHPPRQNQKQ